MFNKFFASQLIQNSAFSEPYKIRFWPNKDHFKVEIILIVIKGKVKTAFLVTLIVG